MTETIQHQRRTDLAPTWNPAEVGAQLYARWVEVGYFTPDPGSDRPA